MSDRRRNGAPSSPQGRPAAFRIAGFPVHASPTSFVLFGLITYTAALGLLPAAAPGASSTAYWVAGAIAAALVMASLLLHELAHAFVARRHGLVVESVTFWLFGGLARFTGQAETPRAEWRIAAIGPLVNLVLGGIGYGIAVALSASPAPALLVAVVGYFAGINLLLGAFNLVPAAPLDGGRVLRAALWRKSGDRDRATITAANVGQMIAAAIVAVGILQLAASNPVGGIWTALVGWFLFTAARAEANQTTTRSALGDLTVRDVMPPPGIEPAPAMPSWRSVAAALQAYRESGDTRTVLPLQAWDGAPAGLVSLDQLVGVPADQRDDVRVAAVAAPLEQVVVTEPGEPLTQLVTRLRPVGRSMAALRLVGHALIVSDGHAVGVVTPADFARAAHLSKLGGPPRPPGPPAPSSPGSDAAGSPSDAPRRSAAA